MQVYHKIVTVFKRDPETKFRTLIEGEFALSEFEYLQGLEWIWTEKVDGTNVRVMFDEDISFGGKSDRAEIHAHLARRLDETFLPLKGKFAEMFKKGCCLYGEGYGAKVQKGGGNYRADQGFVLFDVKIGEHWLQRKNVECIASGLGLDVVPLVGTGTLHEMVAKAKEGFKSQWGDFLAEGIVARPATELLGRNGERVITKIKRRDWPREG